MKKMKLNKFKVKPKQVVKLSKIATDTNGKKFDKKILKSMLAKDI